MANSVYVAIINGSVHSTAYSSMAAMSEAISVSLQGLRNAMKHTNTYTNRTKTKTVYRLDMVLMNSRGRTNTNF